jgi:hypothetical protein
MLADTYNLANLGFTLRDATGLGGLSRELPIAHVPGRLDSVALGDTETKPRAIGVLGWLSVPTLSAANLSLLSANCDELRWRLERESVQLIFDERHADRFYTATLLNPEEIHIPPAFHQRIRELRLQFLCADPVAYATSTTTVPFGATAAETPLGTAPCYPIITLTNPPDTLNIIARDWEGTERARLGLKDLTGAASVVIDMRWSGITVGGVAAPAKLIGTTDFFALDPTWASGLGASAVLATLETDVAATASAA